MQKSFPKRLEEQVARLSAYMSLPEPASGNTFLRLIRLPARGRETVVDLSSCGFRFRLRVTRFLKSLRQNFLHHDSSGNEPSQKTNPSIEISSSYLNADDSAVRILDHLNFNDFILKDSILNQKRNKCCKITTIYRLFSVFKSYLQ